MDVAREEKLPIIVHSRDAAADGFRGDVQEHHAEEIGGVVHCYSYSVEMARDYLNMGFYFGIGGVVTFNNAKKLKEVVSYVPMESLLLETDSLISGTGTEPWKEKQFSEYSIRGERDCQTKRSIRRRGN